jgi:succinoglycan biosynthesis transport protein ExoP
MTEKNGPFHGPHSPESSPLRVFASMPRAQSGHSRVVPAPPPSDEQILSPQIVLYALQRWWKYAVPAGIGLALLAAAALYLTFQRQYEASAWLKIEDRTPYVAFPTHETSSRYVQTQVELIRNPAVLGPVVSRPEIAAIPELRSEPDPIQWLSRHLDIRSVNQSELFKVSLALKDGANSAAIIKAVVAAYFEVRSLTDTEQTQRVIELLEEEKNRRLQEVERLREDVRALTKEASGKSPFATTQEAKAPIQSPVADLQIKLASAEVERELLEAQVKAREESSTKTGDVPEGLVDGALEKHPSLQKYKEAIALKRLKLSELENKLVGGKANPLYQQSMGEITRDEESLNEAKNGLREQVRRDLKATVAGNQQGELLEMKSKLDACRITEQLLRERCQGEMKQVTEVSGDTLELEFKRAELERAEKVFDLIASRITTLRTEQRAPNRVSLVWPVATPTAPVEDNPFKRMMLFALAAFCLPFAAAVGWERIIRRVSNPQQIEDTLQLPVVGEVARLPIRGRLSHQPALTPQMNEALELFEESIDNLRTGLVLSEGQDEMKVITITSAVENEGKTSVAVQLAVSIAHATGQPTLLVDGDMRSPDIHNVLELRLTPGLADVLSGKCPLEEAVIRDWSEQVHVLSAGKLDTSPHKLLGSGGLKPLLDAARQTYRYVVIDTPPVLAASESLVLAQQADATLLCAMRDVSRIDQIERTYQRLARVGVCPAGVVLNGIPTRQYAYRYGRYGARV